MQFSKAPSGRGNEKNLSLHAETIFVNFEVHESTKKVETIDIPLGSYSSFNVCPPCLVASEDYIINPVDNIVCFNSIEKTKTQLISLFFIEKSNYDEGYNCGISNTKKAILEMVKEDYFDFPEYISYWDGKKWKNI